MVAIVPLIFDATMVPQAEEVRYAHVTFPIYISPRDHIYRYCLAFNLDYPRVLYRVV